MDTAYSASARFCVEGGGEERVTGQRQINDI